MKKSDFHFDLPEELIAQTPIENREQSRLLILNKKNGNIQHKIFSDIYDLINQGDCIVMNETKVLPARLFGKRDCTGAKIEILLLNRKNINTWEVLVNPGKKAKIGDKIVFIENKLKCEIIDILDGGNRIIKFEYSGVFEEILDLIGDMPLPPYITEKLKDKSRYQTVYAKNQGSSAAPTAGLHFTNDLIDNLIKKGVSIAKLTLHVGLGTFRPVKTENILEHKMHSEYYYLDEENANIINQSKKNGGKVICVGTTSSRTLETIADENGLVKAKSGDTSIFIYPGYKFKIVDSLITNFHLPESTLIMLVSALAGKENTLNAYNNAIKEKYRFFSFGDAMFICGEN